VWYLAKMSLRQHSTVWMRHRVACRWMFNSVLLGAFSISALAGADPSWVRGLWIWKSPTVLEKPRGAETLRDFCKSEGINEVYVSVSGRSEASEESQLAPLIALLHRSNIRVEALLSSVGADEAGEYRETLLRYVREYERSSPGDGESVEQKAEKVKKASQKYLDLAYDRLSDGNLARMAIALRSPDYGELLPQMLKKIDDSNRANPHYLGWARHSYNDDLKAVQ